MPTLLLIVLLLFLLLCLLTLRCLSKTARLGRRTAQPIEDKSDPDVSLRAAGHLSELIRHQTVSREGLSNFSEWVRLRDDLYHRFPRVHATLTREIVGDYSLIYRWEAAASARDPILFCAHMDVTPADDRFSHDPFGGAIEDGCVWGRGALDCKHILIALLEAAESLIDRGFTPDRDIYFAFGHDEEIGGEAGAGVMAQWFARNNLHFDMVLDEGTPVDRDFFGVMTARVSVSEKGMLNVRMAVTGPGGHAAAPPPKTVTGHLSEAICRLEMAPRRPRLTPLMRDALERLAPYLDFKKRLLIANPRLLGRALVRHCARLPDLAPLVRTTMAVTVVRAGVAHNVLPSSAEAVLNVRLLHGDTPEGVLAYLRDLTRGLPVEFETDRPLSPSLISDYDGVPFSALSESIRDIFGDIPVLPSLMQARSDASRYEPLSACVYRFSPFVLSREQQSRMHGVDERVPVESLGRAVAFYENLMVRMAGNLSLLLPVEQLDFDSFLLEAVAEPDPVDPDDIETDWADEQTEP